VLREHGPSWVVDVMDVAPDEIRAWRGDGDGRAFFDIHKVSDYARDLSVRVPHGHFEGRPKAAGALIARTVFSLVRRLARTDGGIDGVVVVWDMDDQPNARREGLKQARDEAQSWAAFRIVLGCPDPMREAWVLCGFDPGGDHEDLRLRELRRELGFAPHLEAHLLTAKDEQARRSAKRVLRVLTDDDRDREQACWRETSLDTLKTRGELTGLRSYLLEVARHLLPLVRSR
jgi:hypothetical protein